jgi:hypothetical protein
VVCPRLVAEERKDQGLVSARTRSARRVALRIPIITVVLAATAVPPGVEIAGKYHGKPRKLASRHCVECRGLRARRDCSLRDESSARRDFSGSPRRICGIKPVVHGVSRSVGD